MMWGAQRTQGLTLRGAGAARSAVQSDAELCVPGGVLWGVLTEVRDSVHVYSVFEKVRWDESRMVNFKISFIFIYKAFNNISVCRQDSVRACGDGAGQVCRQFQAQCTPSRGGVHWRDSGGVKHSQEPQVQAGQGGGILGLGLRGVWRQGGVLDCLQGELLPLSTSWSTPQVSKHCLCHNVLPILLLNVQLILFVKSAGFLFAAAPWQHRQTQKLRSRRIISREETGY